MKNAHSNNIDNDILLVSDDDIDTALDNAYYYHNKDHDLPFNSNNTKSKNNDLILINLWSRQGW